MSTEKVPIKRALISVSDKTGVADFAWGLAKRGIFLISTGGTARALKAAGLSVTEVSEYTGFPEILDGRLKTLHPKVHGGLLYNRNIPAHVQVAGDFKIPPIDLLVVNLYPFEETIAKQGCKFEEAVEQIDIGGPAMIRSAAKNQESVTVVTDPKDYALVLEEIITNGGSTTLQTRKRLAAKVFALTSRYDAAICNYLESQPGIKEKHLFIQAELRQELRYGENPHQAGAALYGLNYPGPCVAHGKQLSGKEAGWNNLLDMNAAFELVQEFNLPAACIVKHQNPCGVGVAIDLSTLTAYQQAYAGDPISAFGGALALNRPLTVDIVSAMLEVKGFKFDAIVAPAISAGALIVLKAKKKWGSDVIVMATGQMEFIGSSTAFDLRTIPGGILVQTPDKVGARELINSKIVTNRKPTHEEMGALKFAWLVCKHVKSNAIVLAQETTIIGVGAGQMSRVDSVEIAIKKAGERVKGSVLASDAFFPFPDGPEAAAKAGVTAIIQPGGSQKDAETIAVCDKYNMAMVFTGVRHFRH